MIDFFEQVWRKQLKLQGPGGVTSSQEQSGSGWTPLPDDNPGYVGITGGQQGAQGADLSQGPVDATDFWNYAVTNPMNKIQQYGNILDQIQQKADASAWGYQQALQSGFNQAIPQYMQNKLAQQDLANQQLFATNQNANAQRWMNTDFNRQMAGTDLEQQSQEAQRGNLAALHDIAQRGFGLSRENVSAAADINRRNLDYSLVARGAYTSQGGNLAREDITGQLARQMQGIGLQSEQEVAQNQYANKALDLQADKLGLTRQQYRDALQQGLEKSNLDTYMTVDDLGKKITSSKLDDRMLGQKVIDYAMQNRDIYAEGYPGAAPTPTGPEVSYSSGGVTRR